MAIADWFDWSERADSGWRDFGPTPSERRLGLDAPDLADGTNLAIFRAFADQRDCELIAADAV